MRRAVARLAAVGIVACGAAASGQPARSQTEEVDRCPAQRGDDKARTARAADHYARGAVLYEQGDYGGAIREFVAGYCAKPHPSMFYNIGQTYERLLEFDRAVAYFDRFVREADKKEPNRRRATMRVEVLRNLPGRITVATVPPDAEVILHSATGVAARATANREPIAIRRGVYTMRVSLPGYEVLEQKVEVAIGQPYSFYLRLEPKKGVVRVTASPADARLFLGDRLVGVGSYVETVPIGSYALTVEREGQPPVRRQLVVAADRTTEMSVRLPAPPRSGRRELIGAATVGLGLTSSVALASLLDQDEAVATFGTVIGLGVGFGAAYLGVPESIPVGHSSLIIGATAIGAAEGLMVASAFGCDDDTTVAALDRCQEVLGGVALTTGAAGLLVGALAAPRLDLDAGDAALVNSGALWGTAVGSLFFAAFDSDPRIREPLLLAGLNLGVVAGAVLARRNTVTRARVALIDLGGLGGLVAGVAIGNAIGSSDERLNHLALLGLTSGLLTTAWLTR